MKKIELYIVALADSESHKGNYSLILGENKGHRRIAIVIGPFEAQAIAIHLEQMRTNRPLTHDLFKNTLQEVGADLKEIQIYHISGGAFYAKLRGQKANGDSFEVDSRSSDAVALAIRFNVPIFTSDEVLDELGVVANMPKRYSKKLEHLNKYNKTELENLLQEVLNQEDYETASRIRDEIIKRTEA